MQILKQGDYLKNWSLETECTGIGYANKHRPCHSIIKLEDGDIVKLYKTGYKTGHKAEVVFSAWLIYGFICSECHCFTEIPANLIPSEIQERCLTVKEKELSENL